MDTSDSPISSLTGTSTSHLHSNYSIRFYRSSSFAAHLAKWATHYQTTQEQNPFAPATLIVHSHAMAMYLKNKLAKKLGIATRIRFLLPTTFDREVRKTVLHTNHIKTIATKDLIKHPDYVSHTLHALRGDNIFDPKYLEWIILSIISSEVNHDTICNLPVLGNYLFSENKRDKKKSNRTFLPLRAVEFARQMAKVFNRYLFFREFQLRDWEIGHMEPNSEHVWQQWLWQQITKATTPATYRENELEEIKAKLHTNVTNSSLLLQNQFGYTSIFAVSYLPPYYVNLLNTLSSVMPLDFFYFDSTKPVFSTTPKEDESKHYHPAFFEELATMSNAFIELIERQNWETTYLDNRTNTDAETVVSDDTFNETEVSSDYGFHLTLLPSIKSFFNELPNLKNFSKAPLSESSEELPSDPPHSVFSDLQVHLCPNPLVEVEVAKNQILRLMENNPKLSADNILILAPDIEVYRSYLEVVMNRTPHIPFGIMDYKENSQNQILNTVFYVLELFQGDFRVSKLIPLLERECVKTRGGWTDIELNQFVELVQTLGIRWGKDNLNNHWLEKYSWETGIEKIMNGYARSINFMSDSTTNFALHDKFTQHDEPGFTLSGEEAKSIGKIIYWLQNLFSVYEQSTPTCLMDWLARLEEMVTLLLFETRKGYRYSRELNRDHARFQELIKNLYRELTLTDTKNLGENQNFNFPKDFSIDIMIFTNLLRSKFKDHDFLARNPTGVMCGSLLPLRTIPAEATFLLGMNRENFPRHDEENQFDLILKKPQPLDRTKKKDDQLLFFETIFSTRSYLSISYSPGTGFEYSENTSPSILVDGLLQEISLRLSPPEYRNLVNGIQHEHPPHAFLSAPERFYLGSTFREYSHSIYSQAKMLHALNQYHSQDSQKTKRKGDLQKWSNMWNNLSDYLADNHNSSSHTIFIPSIEEGMNNLLRKKTVSAQQEKQDPQNTGNKANRGANLSIRMQDLIAWLTNPVEQYCKRILKIDLYMPEEQLANAEPLQLDSLSEYQMLTPVIKKYLYETFTNNENTISENLKKEPKTYSHHKYFSPKLVEIYPQLPAGNPGKNKLYQLELSLTQVENQLARIREKLLANQITGGMEEFELYKEFDTDMIFTSSLSPTLTSNKLPEKIQVHGWVEALHLGKGLGPELNIEANKSNRRTRIARIYVRYKEIKPNDIIRAWIEHVLLSVNPSVQANEVETWLVGKDEIKFFSAITPELAENELKKLLQIYVLAHATPVPIHEKLVENFLTETTKSTTADNTNFIKKLVQEENSFNPSYLRYVQKIWGDAIESANEAELQQANEALTSFSQTLWGNMKEHLKRLLIESESQNDN